MNSEISNLVKISPVTVIKPDKQQVDERGQPTVNRQNVGLFVAGQNATSEDAVNAFSLSSVDDKSAKAKANAETVKQAVDQGNSLLQAVRRNLQFKVDDATKETVIKIVDSESGEVVRQIPSEEMLSFVKRMQELEGQQGSVIQDRA